MILKELQVSPYLLQLESLIRRLPQQHESYAIVQDQIAREHAGYYGECQLIYPLSKLNFPTDLIYQLRLPYNRSFFQIDGLLMTPRFFLIIEAKNYRDLVVFNEFDQVLHKDRVYQDPVMQVEEQKYQLEMWLQMKGIPPIPIETLVTMTNSQALLKAASSNHKEKVVTLPKLSSKIRDLSEQYKVQLLNVSDLRWLGNQMVMEHQDYVADVLRKFRVNEKALRQGIVCPECGVLGVRMVQLRFQCESCFHRSSQSYLTGLKDFFLLKKKEITNQEFRNFTGLHSNNTAKGMLSRANLKKEGTGRYTSYKLNFNYKEDFDYLKRNRTKKNGKK